MKQDIKIEFYNKLKNGQIKCKQCGATDIYFNEKTGLLKCNYCNSEFSEKIIEEDLDDISNLKGIIIGSNSQDIVNNVESILTFKCQGCGAEISIDTNETVQARCHWCRSFLSTNEKVSNGSIPDVVLPFKISKKDAEVSIKKFVNRRKFFANSRFKKEFNLDNIIGVYFPYTLVDINAHANFSGYGEVLIRKYTIGSGDDSETVYDANSYRVVRDFDILIDDLAVESNSENIDLNSNLKTNNIINSILPFDTENCVSWNANYLKGYSVEKRDLNISDLKSNVDIQTNDITRISLNETLEKYDRGVRWEEEKIEKKGERWKTAYLPVWLYSFQKGKRNKKTVHYVAVNARTGEIMGSVPISVSKTLFASLLIEILSIILTLHFVYGWLTILSGLLFYIFIDSNYRNIAVRHKYEKETQKKVLNMKAKDLFVEKHKGLRDSSIMGVNNKVVKGNKNQMLFLEEREEKIEKIKQHLKSKNENKRK